MPATTRTWRPFLCATCSDGREVLLTQAPYGLPGEAVLFMAFTAELK
jgi:hypothetical protein